MQAKQQARRQPDSKALIAAEKPLVVSSKPDAAAIKAQRAKQQADYRCEV